MIDIILTLGESKLEKCVKILLSTIAVHGFERQEFSSIEELTEEFRTNLFFCKQNRLSEEQLFDALKKKLASMHQEHLYPVILASVKLSE